MPDDVRNPYGEELESDVDSSTAEPCKTVFRTALSPTQTVWMKRTDPRYIYIVMEECENSLSRHLMSENFKQESIFKYMEHFSKGLAYLNWRGFMHRDIKPGNALITRQDRLVISDLDTLLLTTDSAGDTVEKSIFGTKYYIAPEVRSGKYNEKADYHSLGFAFFKMLYPKLREPQIEEMVKKLHVGEHLPSMDVKTSFILYWLTNPDVLERADKGSIMNIQTLFTPKSYSDWEIVEEQAHWILLDQKKLVHRKQFIMCTRAARKYNVLRKVLGRLPNDIFSRLMRHEEADIIESVSRRGRVSRCAAEKKLMIDIVDGFVTLVPASDNYVYICKEMTKIVTPGSEYDIVSFLDQGTRFLSLAEPLQRFMVHNNELEGLCLYLANDVIEKLPQEYVNYQFTRFYKIDEVNDEHDLTRSCNIFSLGLYVFWLVTLELPMQERLNGLNELKAGKLPLLFEEQLPKYIERRKNAYKLLIAWLCNPDRLKRPTPDMLDKINHENPTLSVQSEETPYLLNQSSDYTINKMFLSLTSSSRPEIVDLVWTKLGMFPGVQLYPNVLLQKSRSRLSLEEKHEKENVQSKAMLDVDETGEIYVVPRSSDAVTIGIRLKNTIDIRWTAKDLGEILNLPETISNEEYLDNLHCWMYRPIEAIYLFFYNQINTLVSFHEQGISHGNIKLVKVRNEPTSDLWCLDLPAFASADSEMFTRDSYISEFTSPEQKESLCGSVDSDIYSLGALMLKVFCIVLDITVENMSDTIVSRQSRGIERVPSLFLHLILEMTDMEPDKRPSLPGVLEELKDIRSNWLEPTYQKYRKRLLQHISSDFIKIVINNSQK